jgi:hypothetical protein
MAIDKSQIRVDDVTAPGSGSPIGPINIRSDQNGTWVIIYNTGTDDVNIFPQSKGGNGILLKAGTKRQLGYFDNNYVLYCRSTTVNTVALEVWSNPNKWDSSWASDETTIVASTLISGEPYGLIGDPLNPAGVPIVRDMFTVLGGREARFIALVPNVDIDLSVLINGSAVGSTTRVLANEAFSLGPDPELLINEIVYVNAVALQDFEVRLFAY